MPSMIEIPVTIEILRHSRRIVSFATLCPAISWSVYEAHRINGGSAMSTSNSHASQLVNDSNFFVALMPNRGRTKFLRGAILLFLFIGALAWIVIAVRVFSEFHARHSWPIAQGQLTAATVKSYRGPSIRDRVDHYFVEYEVRFDVPVEQCLTGTSFVSGVPLACVGTVRTRKTDSQVLANSWLERHPLNSAVGVLHDPNGPGVKIVGE